MNGILKDCQLHSTVLAAAREAKHKPPVWSLVPIGLLIYIAGSIAAVICLLPILTVWAGVGGGTAQVYTLLMSNQLLFMLAMNLPIMAAFVVYMLWIEKRSLLSIGFTRGGTLRRYLAGLGWGTGMILAAAGIACAIGGLRFVGFGEEIRWGLWLLMLVGFLFQGMSEEVMCRGFLMVSAANRAPLWVGVVLNSVIFAALHLFNSGITALSFVNLILYALFASFYFLRTDSIWGIGAFHSAWNFVQGCVLGVEVSGNPVTITTAHFVPITESAQAISGGAFGLEGSIAATLVLVAGILLLALLPYNKNDLKRVQQKTISDTPTRAAAKEISRNLSKKLRLFRLIGWFVIVLSLAGMAGSLYNAFLDGPRAHYGVLLPFFSCACACTAGLCLVLSTRKKRAEQNNSANDESLASPKACIPNPANGTPHRSQRQEGRRK